MVFYNPSSLHLLHSIIAENVLHINFSHLIVLNVSYLLNETLSNSLKSLSFPTNIFINNFFGSTLRYTVGGSKYMWILHKVTEKLN